MWLFHGSLPRLLWGACTLMAGCRRNCSVRGEPSSPQWMTRGLIVYIIMRMMTKNIKKNVVAEQEPAVFETVVRFTFAPTCTDPANDRLKNSCKTIGFYFQRSGKLICSSLFPCLGASHLWGRAGDCQISTDHPLKDELVKQPTSPMPLGRTSCATDRALEHCQRDTSLNSFESVIKAESTFSKTRV